MKRVSVDNLSPYSRKVRKVFENKAWRTSAWSRQQVKQEYTHFLRIAGVLSRKNLGAEQESTQRMPTG